jgi:2-polyprenyl-3-methyl-5-hydroxy-6-metoxy-1,4-benzoquinol methylase
MKVFDFGLNWQAFSDKHVDVERLVYAKNSIKTLLLCDNLRNTTVLDVGCGSGLFSIAASQLGATTVMGIDINPRCIAVAEQNRGRLRPGGSIVFQQASALDSASLASLGEFDLVYAWGSLHHTGSMWAAIHNAARCVAPQGTLVLAIYNKHITSPAWTFIKWLYNQLPTLGQQLMAILLAGIIYVAKLLVTRRNPLEKERGMNFWYDVIDWIGGYPYEYATPQEVETFMRSRGLVLQRCIKAQVPTGCNEFVFVRSAKT